MNTRNGDMLEFLICITQRRFRFLFAAEQQTKTRLNTSKYGNAPFNRCTTAIFERKFLLGFTRLDARRKQGQSAFDLAVVSRKEKYRRIQRDKLPFLTKWTLTILELWMPPIIRILHVKVSLILLFD